MKKRTLTSISVATAFGFGLVFFGIGCGNSAQRAAYEHAVKAEQQMTADNATAIIAEYQRVIALQADSELAKLARARVEAVQTRIKAEELHKSVFQEHGVD